MSNSTAQLNLREPEQLNWDEAFKGRTYQEPPPALGPDDKYIQYQGKVVAIKPSDPEDGYLNYQIDLVLVNAGKYDGVQVRTWASTKPFMSKNRETGELTPVKGNPNGLAKALRGAGLTSKPQSNSAYEAAIQQLVGKSVPFVLDWEAKNRDTGEVVRGFNAFPVVPDNPGTRKAILKAGDVVAELDSKGKPTGATRTIQSEVMFANPRFKYFQDPPQKVR